MNFETHKALTDINDELLELANIKVILTREDLERVWCLAKHFNKLQNRNLAEGYDYDAVTSLDLFDETENNCIIVSFKSYLKWSRLQWATMLIANELFLTRQQIKGLKTL